MNSGQFLNPANQALDTELTSHLGFPELGKSDENLKRKVNIGKLSAFVFSVNI